MADRVLAAHITKERKWEILNKPTIDIDPDIVLFNSDIIWVIELSSIPLFYTTR